MTALFYMKIILFSHLNKPKTVFLCSVNVSIKHTLYRFEIMHSRQYYTRHLKSKLNVRVRDPRISRTSVISNIFQKSRPVRDKRGLLYHISIFQGVTKVSHLGLRLRTNTLTEEIHSTSTALADAKLVKNKLSKICWLKLFVEEMRNA